MNNLPLSMTVVYLSAMNNFLQGQRKRRGGGWGRGS